MQGRWQWCQMHRNVKRTTSGSHLDAREVVVVANASKREKHHLRLAFGCEGGGGGKGVGGGGGKGVGGGGGKCVETRKAPPPARVWMRGRWWWQGSWWWWWQMRRNAKSTTSGSRLD